MSESILSKKAIALTILVLLLVLVFFILKPFFTAIILGFVIAFVLNWPYKKLSKLIKKPGIAAGVICFIFLALIAVGVYFLAQATITEAFNLYLNIGKIDLVNLINKAVTLLFPNSPEITTQVASTVQVAITDLINSFIQGMKTVISETPKLVAQLFITFLIAFYGLKDGDKILNFIKEILPFDHDINEKFIKRSKDVVFATIYGQIIVGIIQGIVAGIGFFIFHAQSPLFMALLATFFAILPLLGAWVIWIPVALAMIAAGHTTSGIFLLIYGFLIVSTVDNIVRPFVVGKKSSINPAIIFLGMVGGLLLIGPIGIVAGPIILEYTILIFELYRKGNLKLKLNPV
jgi:predicted PurR-regulated permease PerM